MTKQEWFRYVESNKDKLINLVSHYHPAVVRDFSNPEFTISALATQQACDKIARDIKRQQMNHDVVAGFIKAIEDQDYPLVNRILNETWFGVPESHSSWRVIGFRESIFLMEACPDEFILDSEGEVND